MRVADLTTVELQRLGGAVLRAYLDASAGRQPTAVLAPWIAGQTAAGLADVAPTAHVGIGPVTVLRQGPDRAYVAATATSHGSPPGAGHMVAAELTTADGVLRATRLGHGLPPRLDINGPDRWVVEPDPPEHLTKLLGPLPTKTDARDRWVTAAAVISDYRNTWNVTDERSALGPTPQDAEQRVERDRALNAVRKLVSEIDQTEPARDQVGRARGGPDLTR